MKRKRPNYYAVAVGLNPGIYNNWAECEAQVKGFSGAKYKGFDTQQEAQEYIRENQRQSTAISFNYDEPSTNNNNNNKTVIDLSKKPRLSQNAIGSTSSSISLTAAIGQPKVAYSNPLIYGNKTWIAPKNNTAVPTTNNLSSLLKMEQRNQHKSPVLPQVKIVKPLHAATQKLLEQKKQQQRVHTEKMQKLKQEAQLESIKKGNVGLKIMMNSGYKPGAGLGRNSDGISSVDVVLPKEVKNNKRGIGYGSVRDFSDSLALNEEQQRIFDAVMEGKNVFFTGCAGTGKSMLLARLRRALEMNHKNIAVTASTGVAAVNIGGTTLHRFAGVGLETEPLQIWNRIFGNKANRKVWRQTEVLIIDEISMIDGNFFDILESCARKIRGLDKPFGGLQLILAGDFFQLPPVQKKDKPRLFCFEAKSWDSCVDVAFELKQIHRQSDAEFVSVLSEIRLGRCTKKCMDLLNKCKDTVLPAISGPNTNSNSILKPAQPSILPTVLYCRNVQVDELNNKHLEELPGTPHVFTSVDDTILDAPNRAQGEIDVDMASVDEGSDKRKETLLTMLNQGCLATEKIQLKVGAQVMLLRNISNSLANGSRGVIKSFQRIDKETINNILEEKDVSAKWFNHNKVLPVVLFRNGQEQAIEPEVFTTQSRAYGVAFRTQIPLKLAYALTIHKSQGMTLDFAKLSLSDVFEPGQAYVALSRLRGADGLKILDWKPSAIKSHPKVIEFYNKLQQITPKQDPQDNNNNNTISQQRQNNNNNQQNIASSQKEDLFEDIVLVEPTPTSTQTDESQPELQIPKLEPIEISDTEENIVLSESHHEEEGQESEEPEDLFEDIQLLPAQDEPCE